MRHGLVPGKNVDIICIESGLKELELCGYDCQFTRMVIAHSLNLWRRGEESLAEKTAIDPEFHGISLTSWYRVLAAAKARSYQ